MVDKDKLNDDERAYAQKVGEIMRARKEKSELSFSDISEMTGLSRAHVTRVFYGTIDVRMGDLRRICKLFDADPLEVLAEADAAMRG